MSTGVPLSRIRPCHGCPGRLHSRNHCRNMSWLKLHRPFCCLPTDKSEMQPAQGGTSVRTVALAAAPIRWSLDDVERISRGRPSKAKMGSRAIPHRLNAEERKAFELAKKKGYVVQQANSRRYPLINTYRNYCDALGLLCIRIEQGTRGYPDEVVLDFTPLHLSKAEVSILRAEILNSVMSVSAMDNDQTTTFGEVPRGDEENVKRTDQDIVWPLDSRDKSDLSVLSMEYSEESVFLDGLEGGSEPLRIQASSRSMTKVISQNALDTWKIFLSKTAQ